MFNRIKRAAWWSRAVVNAAVWLLGQPDYAAYPACPVSGAERLGRQLERSAAGWL